MKITIQEASEMLPLMPLSASFHVRGMGDAIVVVEG